MNYIDLHCDTLSEAFLKGKRDIFCFPEAMADVQRLQKAGVAAQFFAIYMLPQRESIENTADDKSFEIPDDDNYIEALCGIIERTQVGHPEAIVLTKSAAEFEKNNKAGKISAFLTLEDGRAVDGKMEKLEQFYEKGIRLISLTWNYENCLGAPNSFDPSIMEQGLTPFGKEAVCRMEELGMMVDVSHLSDGGFWDVAGILHGPFLASHSNCRALSPHPRNLTDEMLHILGDVSHLSDGGFWDVAGILHGPFLASHSNCRALSPHPRNLTDEMLHILGERGGIAGLNFCPAFLHQDITRKDSTIESMITQVKHMVNKGGIECAAIGTDFDGIQGSLEIGTPEKMELLFAKLSAAGFTTGEIEKIAFENVERVIREILRG